MKNINWGFVLEAALLWSGVGLLVFCIINLEDIITFFLL